MLDCELFLFSLDEYGDYIYTIGTGGGVLEEGTWFSGVESFKLVSKAYLDELVADERYTADIQQITEQSAGPAETTVKQRDAWGELALNNYGVYAVWPALMRANGNKAVSVGMTIIPTRSLP